MRIIGYVIEHQLANGELWFVTDLRPPSSRSGFPQSGQAEFNVEDGADGRTIFTTIIWGDREDGRVIRCWNKYEVYIEGKLTETEIFDYNERFYEPAEFEAMLQSVGFVDIKTMPAWENTHTDQHAWTAFSCRKS